MKHNALLGAALVLLLGFGGTASSQLRTLELRSKDQALVNEFNKRTGIIVSHAAAKRLSALSMQGASPASLSSMIERMPVLHITVRPEPPLDYLIRVNDDPPISPPGQGPNNVAVPPGRTVVYVTRGHLPACIWGPCDAEQDEIIDCMLRSKK